MLLGVGWGEEVVAVVVEVEVVRVLTVKCQHWRTTLPCVFGHRKKKKSDQCSKEAQQEIIRSSFLKSREYLGS